MLGRFSRTKTSAEGRFELPVDEVDKGLAKAGEGIDNGAAQQGEPQIISSTPRDGAGVEDSRQADEFIATKVALHQHLLDKINLATVDRVSRDELADQIREPVKDYIKEKSYPLNAREIDMLVSDIADEMLGLGPIEPLLKDDSIADILINTHKQVYIERNGQLFLTPIRFKDETHLLRVLTKIVSAVGRRVDESVPMVDARLADGSRVNAAIKPIAVDGPLVSIRKFSRNPYSLATLVQLDSIRPAMAKVLELAVRGRISMLISGGTGSGKTTMLNALSHYISDKERLITIEDAAELQLQQPHVGRLETRPPNVEGKGEIRQRELVKNALRMRPDRIIVGEVRGAEAFDMLQAMNTGHEGSMTTIHANTTRDALSRLEQMVGMAGMPMSMMAIRSQIASALTVILQIQRLSDGSRRVISIAEITGMEGDVIQMQEIFKFVKKEVDGDGRIIGEYRATGMRPRFFEETSSMGLTMPKDSFDPTKAL
ncbi:MAG: ATPase, T2SS/T4P/T4SS family [Hyphomicrobiales bacterium]|nr:ATPase, T2SS/T4P/T4SS family [Hyphomicrobiales bacterium]